MNVPERSNDLSLSAVVPFLVIAFGIAWGVFAPFARFPDWIARAFAQIGGHHPPFILAVYAPAVAAFALVLTQQGPGGAVTHLIPPSGVSARRLLRGHFAFHVLRVSRADVRNARFS